MKRLIIIAAIALAALAVWLVAVQADGEQDRRYEFVEITRGDIKNTISSSGTLSAVGTIEVGTQVSGIIEEVLVDFNDNVKEGQVMAVLDTTLLAASVRDAEANVLRSQAQYDQSVRDHDRTYDLFSRDLVSKADYDDAVTTMMMTKGSLLSAEATLDRAQANLEYAVVRSPIDGTVIMRNVEEGQTVAASLSSPTLFVIAEDLSEMEIHALVDEGDIGQIRDDLSAIFTVDAYIGEDFEAAVRQIWLQPETISNVVNYTVVLDAPNGSGRLYPGMTATVDFMIDEKLDVLMVPNAAIRFQPTTSMISEMREMSQARMAEMSEDEQQEMRRQMAAQGQENRGGPNRGMGGPPGAGGPGGHGEVEEGTARLCYVDENGRLNVAHVRTGATDGRSTEIIGGPEIGEGMKIIAAINEDEEERGASANRLAIPFGGRP